MEIDKTVHVTAETASKIEKILDNILELDISRQSPKNTDNLHLEPSVSIPETATRPTAKTQSPIIDDVQYLCPP